MSAIFGVLIGKHLPEPTFSCGDAAAADVGITTGASDMFSVVCDMKETQKIIYIGKVYRSMLL